MFLCPLKTLENLKVFFFQGVEKRFLVFSQVVKWKPWPEMGKTLTWILLVSSSRVISIFIHVFKFSMFIGDLKHPVFFSECVLRIFISLWNDLLLKLKTFKVKQLLPNFWAHAFQRRIYDLLKRLRSSFFAKIMSS